MIPQPFKRHPNNPLITPSELPIPANAALNPGVAELDGEIILLIRIEDRRGISEIRTARSKNGVDGWVIADKPLIEPDLPEYPYEEWGCEDARVTRIGPRKWIIAYTAYSRYGPSVALATTTDFESIERLGIVLPPTNKDATVFPHQFDNLWVMLHRPVTGGQEHIWYACAEHDLTHWTAPGVLLPERGGPWWDGLRIGVGAPPIQTEEGWLLIYHGVKEIGNRPIYRLGLALLDINRPRKVLARASDWVFAPEAHYEQSGLLPGVVYTCGAVPVGDEIWMYYGAADTVIGLAIAKTRDLLDFVWKYDYIKQIGRQKGMEK
ncbi:MAG TPA: glycosidase [Armatimonadota bacterium]|nr:glycosidase [Armatimonadota bacterium]HPP74021.1 glycosidase [Armatimonadota bacterium]